MGTILYTTQFGSHLFGTSTPKSDLDIKHIELPDIQGLLVGRKIGNRVVKTNTLENTKNGVDDIDVEFVPLQAFARDFYEGQTYALEIAFSIDGTHAGQTHYDSHGQPSSMDPNSLFCQFVSELKRDYLTSNTKAMIGYVINQASLYSFKGERLNCAKAVKAFISKFPQNSSINDGMQSMELAAEAANLASEFPKYFSLDVYEIGAGRNGPCFKLLEKTIPWSITASSATDIVAASIKKYGQRSKDASADNVDWKATMHAVRILDEGIQLIATGKIALPHPPAVAQRFLAIRRGEVPLEEIKVELDTKLDRLTDLSNAATLPPVSEELTARFDAWLMQWMMCMYGLQSSPTPSHGPSLKR